MFRPMIRYHVVMVDDVLWLVLVVLATARVIRYVTKDKLNNPVRVWAVHKFGEDSLRAYLLFCEWCVGVWAAAGLVLLGYFGYGHWWAQLPILWLAVAQVAPALLQLGDLKPQITIVNQAKEEQPWRS